LVLERRHCVAERGLGAVEAARGFRKAASLGDSECGAHVIKRQAVNIHDRIPGCKQTILSKFSMENTEISGLAILCTKWPIRAGMSRLKEARENS
jgi:hypothetical protein